MKNFAAALCAAKIIFHFLNSTSHGKAWPLTSNLLSTMIKYVEYRQELWERNAFVVCVEQSQISSIRIGTLHKRSCCSS